MNRALAVLVAFSTFLSINPESQAAAQLRTGLAFAFAEKAPAGTHFWCVFPEFRAQWNVVLYEKQQQGTRITYTPLAQVAKPAGEGGPWLHQMMTVPPHNGRECFLVAYRNTLQQPYRGWTEYNPFGWHTFGFLPPVQALVAEIPAGTPAKDISRYQRLMLRQWTPAP